jgi:hypothetical protein
MGPVTRVKRFVPVLFAVPLTYLLWSAWLGPPLWSVAMSAASLALVIVMCGVAMLVNFSAVLTGSAT